MAYNPALHITFNTSVGIAQAVPTDARSYFYDTVNYKYRAYVSTAEALTYLEVPKYRVGHFSVIVNIGGTLLDGVITGGENVEYWFKNGVADGDLVLKAEESFINVEKSIVGDGSNSNKLRLVNDNETPPANYFYNTDSTGVKGWYPLGGGGLFGDILSIDEDGNPIFVPLSDVPGLDSIGGAFTGTI